MHQGALEHHSKLTATMQEILTSPKKLTVIFPPVRHRMNYWLKLVCSFNIRSYHIPFKDILGKLDIWQLLWLQSKYGTSMWNRNWEYGGVSSCSKILRSFVVSIRHAHLIRKELQVFKKKKIDFSFQLNVFFFQTTSKVSTANYLETKILAFFTWLLFWLREKVEGKKIIDIQHAVSWGSLRTPVVDEF